MKPFPEEYQFLEFFDSEPKLYDADVPWFYNHLSFYYEKENETIICDIEPAYNEIKISWFQKERLKGKFIINEVKGLEIEGTKNQTLIVSFHEDKNISLFKLRLKPYVQIEWGIEKDH